MTAWVTPRNAFVVALIAIMTLLPVYAAASVVVNLLWDTPGWHGAAHQIMGV